MPKRSSKPPSDENEAAFRAVERLTDSERPKRPAEQPKNPAAVQLGSLGGRKGGKARAAKLTPEQRREIAKRAAAARWKRSKPTGE
jgi:hypothetical protein